MNEQTVRLTDLGPNERALIRALWRMEDAKAAARRIVEKTTEAQGLPETVTDPVVLQRIGTLLRQPRTGR